MELILYSILFVLLIYGCIFLFQLLLIKFFRNSQKLPTKNLETIHSDEIDKSLRIILSYGKSLEIISSFAKPLSKLEYSKEEIRNAGKYILENPEQFNPELEILVKDSIQYLRFFIEDEKANHINNLIEKYNNGGLTNEENLEFRKLTNLLSQKN